MKTKIYETPVWPQYGTSQNIGIEIEMPDDKFSWVRNTLEEYIKVQEYLQNLYLSLRIKREVQVLDPKLSVFFNNSKRS